MKLSDLLKSPLDNQYLSARVFTTGYNNIGGGYAARIIGYTASTKTIRLVALTDYHYNEDLGWSADRYQIGDTIYISTGNQDHHHYHAKKIVSVTPNTTTVGSGDTVSTMLNHIDIELDSAISMYQSDEEVSTSNTFDPTNIYYPFQANVLEDISGRPMCRTTFAASNLKCIPGTQVAIYSEGDEVTRFSQSWSGDTLTITFTDSQATTPNKQFYLVSKVNGVEATTYIAIVKDDDFAYTVNVDGEYHLATGCNSTTSGNGNVNAGDFSVVGGLFNTNLSMNSDVSGTENDVGEGSDNIVKGCTNVAYGRNNIILGNRHLSVTDNNLLIGGMCQAFTMNNVGLGHSIHFYPSQIPSGGNFAVGSQLDIISHNGTAIGRDLTLRADDAILFGQHGELPEYTGNLSPVTESYSEGDKEGIHYQGAVAIATGEGSAEPENQHQVSFIFSKYKWKKNPAYPYGTGDSLTVCPDVVGAGSGITAAELRSKTTEEPILLENYPLLTVVGNVEVDGSIIAKKIKSVSIDEASSVVPVMLDPTEALTYKITFNAIATAMLTCDTTKYPEGVTVRVYVKNGGANLLFDNASMHPLGEIPALTSDGYDAFEVVRLDDVFYYRHLGQYTNN